MEMNQNGDYSGVGLCGGEEQYEGGEDYLELCRCS